MTSERAKELAAWWGERAKQEPEKQNEMQYALTVCPDPGEAYGFSSATSGLVLHSAGQVFLLTTGPDGVNAKMMELAPGSTVERLLGPREEPGEGGKKVRATRWTFHLPGQTFDLGGSTDTVEGMDDEDEQFARSIAKPLGWPI
jgi:hypothetical protein